MLAASDFYYSSFYLRSCISRVRRDMSATQRSRAQVAIVTPSNTIAAHIEAIVAVYSE